MRFGVDLTTDHMLEDVGRQFDVTCERIPQIEAMAARKLMHPSRGEQFRSFMLEDCTRKAQSIYDLLLKSTAPRGAVHLIVLSIR